MGLMKPHRQYREFGNTEEMWDEGMGGLGGWGYECSVKITILGREGEDLCLNQFQNFEN